VEALDQGCPFQGVIAPASRDAATEESVSYPAFITLDQARAASSTGEVFINGQHDATNKPRPVARSFVKVTPTAPPTDYDWFNGFDASSTPDFTSFSWDTPCGNPDNPNCFREYRQASDFADLSFTSTTPNRYTIASVLGELWITYADVGADVAGHFRMTPNVRGQMTPTTFLHVTMEADSFATSRRYPQMIISDGDVPVQWTLPKSNAVIIQPFSDSSPNWPNLLQLQVCDHRGWEVNNQCPVYDLYRIRAKSGGDITGLAPLAEVAEHTGVDRSTRYDAFLSTTRAYLFVDNQPFGCATLPSKGIPSGTVTVTFGDVLYHSGVDSVFAFHKTYQQVFAKRHFDNLGFKSGEKAPPWDESRFPCFPTTALK
jgi:hypothetical protein